MKTKQHLLLPTIAITLIVPANTAFAIDEIGKCSSASSCTYDTTTYAPQHASTSFTNLTQSQCIANYTSKCWRPDVGKCVTYTDNGYFASASNASCPSICENMGYNAYIYNNSSSEFGCACKKTDNGTWKDIGNGRERYYSYTYKKEGKCNIKASETATTQYRCKSGYYGNASSGCTACPANASCNGGTGTTTFVCNINYYKNGTACTKCPDSAQGGLGTLVNGNKAANADTYDSGATSITECYIDGFNYSDEAFYDATGTFYLTDECFYKN